MPAVDEVIGNKGLDLTQTRAYAAILGESPSKGARSPLLWNQAFAGLDISGMMHPMDVAADELGSVVGLLREDERFIGGAVTMPHKIGILPHLDALEREAEAIGAVNCIYRDGPRLIGSNTDGAGARWSLESALGESVGGKTVLLLGTGGAGAAVAAYIAAALTPSGRLVLANRSAASRAALASRLRKICPLEETTDWPVTPATAGGADILINCSTVGFAHPVRTDSGEVSLKTQTPLGSVDMESALISGAERATAGTIARNLEETLVVLAAMNDPFVFDIIYQPAQTVLLYLAALLGYRTLNGLPMNLEQAVIAFDKATTAAGLRPADAAPVRELMRGV